MTETVDFELALERRLRARAGMASRPFDAAAIAHAATATHPARRPLALALPRRWGLVLAIAGLVMALLAGAAVVAGLLRAQESRLAVARPDGIYLLRADGSVVKRITDAGTNPRLSWSADGQLLLVSDMFDNGNTSRLTVYREDGTTAWQPSSFEATTGAWSHRGHRVAWAGRGSYDSQTEGLYVADADTGKTRQLALNVNSWTEAVEWSPDDSRILTMAGAGSPSTPAGSLLVVPADGGSPVSLGAPTGEPMRAGYWLHNPRWSPDGKRIAVNALPSGIANESRILVVDSTSGEVVDQTTDGSWAAWSPDGSSIAYASSRPGTAGAQRFVIARLPLSSGRTTFVFADDGRSDALCGWMPDGRFWVVRQRPDAGYDLWVANADATGAELHLHDVQAAAFRP